MGKIEVIKKRLAAIQGNFNPEKSTYKIIDTIINSDLSPNEVLMELSKIKGVNKYPDDLKREYISIIDDLKENIIDAKKLEEKKQQEKTTKELKELIDNLENRKQETKTLDEMAGTEEVLDSEEVKEEKQEEKEEVKSENKTEKEDKVKKVKTKKVDEEEKLTDDSLLEDRSNKIHVFLLIGIAFIIILTVLVVFLY